MITPLIASMFATNLSYGSAATMFGANQSRAALANSATGTASIGESTSLASQDKALSLQGIQAQTNYQVALAMQEGASNLRKKNQELRERMLQNGALFF
ncbi:hypothetical protein [Vampirovibrio sp.]|uniref:hypothetical protein n=1 Tax=Vampirovibrio sp. TaxID=2717857 RepID=UPI003593F88B